MNTFNKIIATTLVAGSLLMSGCNPDEFLTEVNPNAITEDTFWKTEGDAEAALTTVYAALQFPCISGGNLTFEMAKSDIAGTNDWTRHFSFTEFTTADNEHAVLGTWAELYTGIFRANQVIDNIPTMEALSDERKIEIVAQAKFLRAFYYFNLIHTYGKAIIKLDSKTNNHNVPLSTMAEVQEQVIFPDLEYAIEHLPIVLESQQLGRVARGAAITLLGKTYLYNKDWDMAAAEFKKVIDSGLYTLVPNFMDNFRGDIAFNSESIFEVPYDGSINPGTANADMTDDDPNNSGGESTGMSRTYGPYSLGGWQMIMPTYFMHELMTADSVANSTAHSSRYTATLAGIDAEGLYYNKTTAELKAEVGRRWAFGESSYIKKYSNWYHQDLEDPEWRSSINYKQFRLSDVYLMYAEAVLEGKGDIVTAIEYIDKVRTRAGVVTLQDYINANGTIPQLHVSKDLYGTRPEVSATVDNIRTHIRMVERPTELAFENSRWRDLVRWGIVKSVFTQHHEDEVVRIERGPDPSRAPLYIQARIRPDFVNNYNFYVAEKHDYFPIPAAEIQANEAL